MSWSDSSFSSGISDFSSDESSDFDDSSVSSGSSFGLEETVNQKKRKELKSFFKVYRSYIKMLYGYYFGSHGEYQTGDVLRGRRAQYTVKTIPALQHLQDHLGNLLTQKFQEYRQTFEQLDPNQRKSFNLDELGYFDNFVDNLVERYPLMFTKGVNRARKNFGNYKRLADDVTRWLSMMVWLENAYNEAYAQQMQVTPGDEARAKRKAEVEFNKAMNRLINDSNYGWHD
jgi:hypothetical protein